MWKAVLFSVLVAGCAMTPQERQEMGLKMMAVGEHMRASQPQLLPPPAPPPVGWGPRCSGVVDRLGNISMRC